MDLDRTRRTREGRPRLSYWVPELMRGRNPVRTVPLLCRRCKLVSQHRFRADRRTAPRSVCRSCEKEQLAEIRERNWQREKLRLTLRGAIDRCHNPERMKRWSASAGIAGAWRDYGAAGITVCSAFRDPEHGLALLERIVGLPPSKADSLDRIDPWGGYFCGSCDECRARGMDGEPNVRWASKAVQAANRRNSRFLAGADPATGRRVVLTLNEWGRRLGLSPRTIAKRLEKAERGELSTEAVLDPRRWARDEEPSDVCPF